MLASDFKVLIAKLREVHNDIRDECNCGVSLEIGMFHARPNILDLLAKRFAKIDELSFEADKLLHIALTEQVDDTG